MPPGEWRSSRDLLGAGVSLRRGGNMDIGLSDVVGISYARTPIGRFGGGFKFTSANDLGAAAIREAIARAGINPEDVDEVYFGNTRQTGNGPNPPRTAAVRAGVPADVNVCSLTMACPSGDEGFDPGGPVNSDRR